MSQLFFSRSQREGARKRLPKAVLQRWAWLAGLLVVLGTPNAAIAQTALTWARVELLRNRVQLIPQGSSARAAQLADILGIGDALRTARSSRAELRFNDGSLARIGESATFRFTPNTRNFQLSNGTVLLLIPPGRGRTTIQTPNAVTGIQGSALFVRFIEETNTTIVGALTTNPGGPMVAYTADGSQEQALYAGQMVVIEGDRIIELYDFDLAEFYRTSGLIQDLNSESVEGVYQEMLDALEQQQFDAETPENSPSVLTLPTVGDASSNSDTFAAVPEFETSPAQQFHRLPGLGQSQTARQATAEPLPPTAPLNNTRSANQASTLLQPPRVGSETGSAPATPPPLSETPSGGLPRDPNGSSSWPTPPATETQPPSTAPALPNPDPGSIAPPGSNAPSGELPGTAPPTSPDPLGTGTRPTGPPSTGWTPGEVTVPVETPLNEPQLILEVTGTSSSVGQPEVLANPASSVPQTGLTPGQNNSATPATPATPANPAAGTPAIPATPAVPR